MDKMYYGSDKPLIVLYNYEDVGRPDTYAWEFCDPDYFITMISIRTFDNFDSCYNDLANAFNAATKAPVRMEGEFERKKLKRKKRIEVFSGKGAGGDEWYALRLIDKEGRICAYSMDQFETAESAKKMGEQISEWTDYSKYHYLNYEWHEEKPLVDENREFYVKLQNKGSI